MPQLLIAAVDPVRLSSYQNEWARRAGVSPADVSKEAVASLYVWQVSLNAAWFETLAYTEAVLRRTVDHSLRVWNLEHGRTENWLDDGATPLAKFVARSAQDARRQAQHARTIRTVTHKGSRQPLTLDDLVSQLSFGSISTLFPRVPPSDRTPYKSGLNARENLWISGLDKAFPHLTTEQNRGLLGRLPREIPESVSPGYAVGRALERLRRLRNRISHHEQTFSVEHVQRLHDVSALLRSIDPGAARSLARLDRVRRTLALRPLP
ncbi:hypothetical protein D9V34_02525 [Mycetocola lacteus]|uniref:Abi family protein n=1 Tax=Mycetocola lacteus TaxID=76637 RepID=A0A3L7AW11_9MICO|nr:Abi family protein [Mycetocola lacteus]RLP83708.1 hypothetical protein D9V34_02525 [Mycetocola lacteus]